MVDKINVLNARSPLYKTLVAAKLGFYMTGYRVFNFRFHSLTWVDFTKFINQVQLSLFSSCLFRQSYFMQGAQSAPCNPMELHIFSYGEQITKHLFGLQRNIQTKSQSTLGNEAKLLNTR